MLENRTQNGITISDQSIDLRPIQLSPSLALNESLLIDLHQNRYIRWNVNEISYKVNSMDWNPSGTHMMCSSDDKTVRIYDLNGDEVSVIPSKKHGCDCVQFLNETNTAIFASKYESNNGSDYHKIRHLDIDRKTFLHYYCGHEKQVTSIDVNRYHNCFLSSSLDSTVRLWDCRLAADIRPGDRRSFGVIKSLSRSVAAFEPMGVVFAVCLQSDSSIRLYDMRNYTKGPFKVSKLNSSQGSGEVHGIRFSPNGQMIALSTDGSHMRVINAYSLDEISVLNGFKNELKVNLELSWTPDSKYLFCGSSSSFAGPGNYGNLNLFNALDGTHIKQWKTMHESFTRIVKFNPMYYMIASACHDVAYWSPTPESLKQLMAN